MTIEEKISKEKEKLAKLNGKKAELDNEQKKLAKDIQRVQDTITSLENQVKASNMREIENAIAGRGLNISDILLALKTGDVLDLQEKIDNAKTMPDDTKSDHEDNVNENENKAE